MSHTHDDPAEEPTTEELQEPSTEKEPGEEPTVRRPEDPEPSHHAVGIGVIGGPQTIADDPDAGSEAANDQAG